MQLPSCCDAAVSMAGHVLQPRASRLKPCLLSPLRCPAQVCDGAAPMFRNQPIAVIGGGDSGGWPRVGGWIGWDGFGSAAPLLLPMPCFLCLRLLFSLLLLLLLFVDVLLCSSLT